MERKKFVQALGVSIVGGAGLLNSCVAHTSSFADSLVLKPGMILHSVYFWLKEGITEDEEADFLLFFEALKVLPGMAYCHVGKPAATTPREVVDNSFSYHWLVAFETMDNVNLYEKHPDHIAAAEKYSHYWQKVEVKDTVI